MPHLSLSFASTPLWFVPLTLVVPTTPEMKEEEENFDPVYRSLRSFIQG